MENKITLPKFATLMAEKSGFSKRRCEDFLREFFQTLSRNLENGEEVNIKGFGSFRLSTVEPRKSIDVSTGEPIEIPGHVKVVFTPAKEMAEAVNAPFEFFEAVEASDSLTDEEVAAASVSLKDDLADTADKSVRAEETERDPEEEPDRETQDDSNEPISPNRSIESVESVEPVDRTVEEEVQIEAEDSEGVYESASDYSLETEGVAEEVPSPAVETDPETTSGPEGAESEVPTSIEQTAVRHRRFGLGFVWGFVTGVVVLGAGLFIGYKIIEHKLTHDGDKDGMVVSDTVAVPAETVMTEESGATIPSEDSAVSGEDNNRGATGDVTADNVATKASDEPRYDTISKTRYLTTMAKEYYGNYNLWPYIYEENKDILGHPDRIRPGTRVRIPDLKKYGVDPANPEHIRKAKEKGVAIYNRYRQ